MNERIEELVEQAITQNESVWPDFRKALTGSGSLYLHAFAEEFAELIVRECARACEYNEAPPMLDQLTADQYALIAQGRKTASYLVKQHFGVE